MSIRKGNTIIAGNIDAVYETDEQTITVNQNEKLQVIGTINKNTLTPKYDWIGTKAEYNDLEQIHDDWLYFITDDMQETITLSNCVGQIIQAICTSSYIPNGCIPCDGTEYTADRFIDFWTNYLTCQPAKILTCTYNEYNTEISTYGQCAKFAIDTSSQKFKAPTIKDGSIIQQAMSDSELGKAYNAGLPNITGQLSWGDRRPINMVESGAFYNNNGSATTYYSNDATQTKPNITYFDASRSSSIYGNSDTVQPNAIALRYFVVVVDTYLNQSQLDWTTYTQSLNNKADKNLVNTGLITNCITEIPQDIKLELNDGVLTLKAGSVVYIPDGFEEDGVTKKFNRYTIPQNVSLGKPVNTRVYVCSYCIDNNTIDYTETQDCSSGNSSSGTQYNLFYDTVNNTCKRTDNTGSTWRVNSFPFCIVSADNALGIVSIDKIFNGFGYIGYTVFVLPGVKGLCPAGKNEYGVLLSQSFTTESVKAYTFSNDYTGPMTLAFNGTNFHADCVRYYERANRPSGQNCCWLDPTTNTFNVDYWNGSVDNYYFDTRCCLIFTGHRTANARIDDANFKQPTELIDYSSADFIIAYKRPTASDTSWYRLYKSGWVEQGNTFTPTADPIQIVYHIPMKDTYYSIQISVQDTSPTDWALTVASWNNKATTGFLLYEGYNGSAQTMPVSWEINRFAAGY